MNLQTFSDQKSWLDASVAWFEKAVNESNHAAIALSGGSTPIPIYEAIALEAKVNHTSIEVYQVDERYVPPDHPDSNQKLIMDHLILPAQERAKKEGGYSPFCCATFFPTHKPIEKAVKSYHRTIKNGMAPSGGLTLSILGIGPDGHTASLFPHSPALHETKRFTAHTTTDTFTIHDRLTLTFPAIMSSRHLLVLLKGKNKQAILDDLLHSNKSIDEMPAKKLLEHPNLTIHFCTD